MYRFRYGAALRASAISVAALSAGCAGAPEADEAIASVRIYDLVTALPRATVEAPAPEYVVGRAEAIGNEQQRVIFMHAPSSVMFPEMTIDASSVFTAAIAVQDEAWDKGGDGVEFTVAVIRGDDRPVNVFSRYIDPKRNEAERGWIAVRLPLEAFAGEAVRIQLRTAPGPDGNTDSDWAVWGSPEIRLPPEP